MSFNFYHPLFNAKFLINTSEQNVDIFVYKKILNCTQNFIIKKENILYFLELCILSFSKEYLNETLSEDIVFDKIGSFNIEYKIDIEKINFINYTSNYVLEKIEKNNNYAKNFYDHLKKYLINNHEKLNFDIKMILSI